MALTQVSPALLNAEAQAQGFRNRIINGDMRIDQRNAGASVSVSTNTTTFITDRFNVRYATGSGLTSQQSTTAPTGFVNSLLITVGTGASASSSANNRLLHVIEGNNIADLAWGSANAKTVTLSFWVRSSLTGTFSFVFQDASAAYNYIGTYSINSANTWEQKTITISGPTSGTWNTNNTAGIQILFDLGSGSDFNGTAGWSATASVRRTSGSVRLVETSGATFYITGVQLEVGSVATEFERRPYGQELQLCQRYYELTGFGAVAIANTSTQFMSIFQYKVSKRATPTASLTVTSNIRYRQYGTADRDASSASIGSAYYTTEGANVIVAGFSGLPTSAVAAVNYTTSSNDGNLMAFSAEL